MVVWVIVASVGESILPASPCGLAGRMDDIGMGLLHQYLTAVDDVDALHGAADTLT